MTKHEKIKNFLEKHKNVPQQRSPEWINNRKFSFGGSMYFF